MTSQERAIVDGRPATGADLGLALAARGGHFTAMQVRGHAVRGLELHLERLEQATRELFGQRLDRALVLDGIAAALGGDPDDASVRVNVTLTDRVHVIVSTGAPVDAPTTPRRLMTVAYRRFLPHIKHGGGFPSIHLGRRAAAEGFDDALLVAEDGTISEGTITNLGCFDGERVVWPKAPMLTGITLRLLRRELARAGIPQETRPLKAGDLAGFRAVFLANSWGISPVGEVDGAAVPYSPEVLSRILTVYEATPWDPIPRR
ncbi:aminotransferase class IV [Nonomuraea typhae]|uniref:aminotransferase class IV n=1 Tax=Nonomuraea typhae TaxID=2603600 RepID=UPI0012F7ED8C|nr:aminotransferase class IV [Nonomuraea typhae]